MWAAERRSSPGSRDASHEPRFHLASLAWLGLAFAHGLAFDAPLERLFEREPGRVARCPERGGACNRDGARRRLHVQNGRLTEEGHFARLFSDLLDAQPWLRRGAYALAGATALYAGSLAVVSLPESWDRGHALVAALWSLVAASPLVIAGRKSASLTVLGASVGLVLFYDLPELAEVERSWSFGIVAVAALAVAIGWELRSHLRARATGGRRSTDQRTPRRLSSRPNCSTGSRKVQRSSHSRSATRRDRGHAVAAQAGLRFPCSACSRSS